jgi:hypothetical protein
MEPPPWALATQKKLAYLGFQCLDHPPYSPDRAPSDNHLFPGLKKQLKEKYRDADKSLARPGMKRLTRQLQPRRKLAYLGFQCLDHPPYSPDLAPSKYHLFPGLKKKRIEREVGRPKDLSAEL